LATLLLAVGWLLPTLLGPAYWPMTGRNAAMASPMEAAVLTALDALTVISLVLLGRWLIGRTEGGPAGELAELRAANTNLATRLHEAESHAAEHNSALQEVVTKMGETQRFRETLQQLTELLQLCESETESEQIIVQGGPQLFPRWSGALTFADDGGLMMVAASWGHPFTAQQSTEVDCWAVRRGRLHQSSIDPEQHALSPVCSHFGGDGALPPGIKATICAPLLKSFDRPGVLHLVAYETMSEEDMQAAAWRAETFADALKLSLGNLRLRTSLREQAVHDEMTELFNRRHFDEVLNRELSRSQRTGEGLILAILDIDHFKNFNDNYGHEAGDEVLKKVAEHLRRFVRAYDIACRVGGEELGIIMPRVHIDEAFTRLNQLLKEIGACVLTYKGTRLPAVTVSVGVAELDSGTPDDLLRRADTAMYAAKNSGRNRVIRWSAELDAESPASVGQNAEAAPAATGSPASTEAESVPQENQADPTAVGQDSAREGIKRRLDSSNRGALPE
jgi:diguanylate cyclase (GGDEF)-like protein